jgi:hypothetical protein
LTLYGPEAKPVRKEARQFVEDAVYRIWPEDMKSFQLRPKNNGKRIIAELDLLVPKDEAQASAKVQVATLTQSLTKEYWLMFLETEQTAISMPLLMVLTSWLIAIFVSFGLFAPPNPTVMVTLIVCGLAASAAIFLIMEMYSPFSGMLKISPTAVHDALTQMAIDQ